MALRGNQVAEASKKFEDIENPAPAAAAAPQAAPAQPAGPKPGTAVARPKSTAVGFKTPDFRKGALFGQFKRDEPMFSFGMFPKFSGVNGGLQTNDGKIMLGDSCIIQLVGYNDYWMITPGERDDKLTPLVRYSFDGVTLSEPYEGIENVDEYLKYLRGTENLEGAKKKQYTSLWGVLLEVAPKANHAGQAQIGSFIEISLAPRSRDSLFAHEAVRIMSNFQRKTQEIYSNILTISAEAATSKGNNFTKLVVGGTPDAKAKELVDAMQPIEAEETEEAEA